MSKSASFPEMQKRLQRERAKAQPENELGLEGSYKSVYQLNKHLELYPEDLTSTAKDGTLKTLQHKMIISSSATCHMLLYDPELMNQFTDNEVKVDGTFDSVTQVKGVQQLVTIMGTKYNVVSFCQFIVS